MLPTHRLNNLVDIIPVADGCLGSCTYCKTWHARGRLRSATPDALRARLRAGLGMCEV